MIIFYALSMTKMDYVKTAFPRFQVANKMTFGLGQLHVTFISMRAHGHGDERYE
jgi:hypothetical protein